MVEVHISEIDIRFIDRILTEFGRITDYEIGCFPNDDYSISIDGKTLAIKNKFTEEVIKTVPHKSNYIRDIIDEVNKGGDIRFILN